MDPSTPALTPSPRFYTRPRRLNLSPSPLNPAAASQPILACRFSSIPSPLLRHSGSTSSPAFTPRSPLSFLTHSSTLYSSPPRPSPPALTMSTNGTSSSILSHLPRMPQTPPSPLRAELKRQHRNKSKPRHIDLGSNLYHGTEYRFPKYNPSPLEHLVHLWTPPLSPPVLVPNGDLLEFPFDGEPLVPSIDNINHDHDHSIASPFVNMRSNDNLDSALIHHTTSLRYPSNLAHELRETDDAPLPTDNCIPTTRPPL